MVYQHFILGNSFQLNFSLFNAIGICIPVTVFIFMIIVPLTKPGNQNSEDNQTTNNFIVVRWLFFTFMLIFLFIACIPLLKLWRTVLIPQRVDSRSQKEYHESYQARMDLEENKEKMDGGGPAFEGESILPLKDNVNLNEGTDEERPLTLFNNDENKSPDEDKERRRKRLKALKRIIKTDQLEQINEI